MSTHKLKLNQYYIAPILSGAKTFEIRKFDRNFKVGDTCILKGWDPVKEKYTGDQVKVYITYILPNDACFISPEYIAFSFRVTRSNYENIPVE